MVLHMIINAAAIEMELPLALVALVLFIRVSKTRQNFIGVHLKNGNVIGKEQTVIENIKF